MRHTDTLIVVRFITQMPLHERWHHLMLQVAHPRVCWKIAPLTHRRKQRNKNTFILIMYFITFQFLSLGAKGTFGWIVILFEVEL